MSQRTRAQARYRARIDSRPRASVPTAIREALEAKSGDKLIFEQGCESAVFRAALKGTYFVVTLERAKKVEPVIEEVEVVNAPNEPMILESFAETVRKRLNV